MITIPGLLGSMSSCYEAAPRARGAKLRPIVTDVARSVCVCVNHIVDGGPYSPRERTLLRGHCHMMRPFVQIL